MSSTSREFLGHPVGLSYLFFTEMWERFSFYGMRALLVLYMTQYLLLDPSLSSSVIGFTALEGFLKALFGDLSVIGVSSQIYGLYTGFVYFTPFIGGLVADRYLGKTNAVYVGALLMAVGHFLMAFESFFLIALLFLIAGNGMFKPNLTAQVGSLYQPGDQRRRKLCAPGRLWPQRARANANGRRLDPKPRQPGPEPRYAAARTRVWRHGRDPVAPGGLFDPRGA